VPAQLVADDRGGPETLDQTGRLADRAFVKAGALGLDLPPPPGRYLPGGRFLGGHDPEVGHASTLVRIGGLRVLTDRHFSRRASPLGYFICRNTSFASIKVTRYFGFSHGRPTSCRESPLNPNLTDW